MLMKIADIGSRGPIFLSYNIFLSIGGGVRVRILFGPEDAIGISELCVDYIPQLYVKFDIFKKSGLKNIAPNTI